MRVNQLARKTGVTADTVRYYTRIGILQPQRNADNGYKDYSDTDAQQLRFVLRAKQLGFSLEEVKEIVAMRGHGDSPCPRVRQIVRARIERARQEMAELQALLDRLNDAVALWERLPDQVPTGRGVCNLIDTWQPETTDGAAGSRRKTS